MWMELTDQKGTKGTTDKARTTAKEVAPIALCDADRVVLSMTMCCDVMRTRTTILVSVGRVEMWCDGMSCHEEYVTCDKILHITLGCVDHLRIQFHGDFIPKTLRK
jgi:hypothetical protein